MCRLSFCQATSLIRRDRRRRRLASKCSCASRRAYPSWNRRSSASSRGRVTDSHRHQTHCPAVSVQVKGEIHLITIRERVAIMNIPEDLTGRDLIRIRQKLEGAVQHILAKDYGQAVDPGIPLRYYLDFKTDRRLQQLCEALDRMERGVFGRCMHCQRPIKRDVMNKSPLALVCLKCAGDTGQQECMPMLKDR